MMAFGVVVDLGMEADSGILERGGREMQHTGWRRGYGDWLMMLETQWLRVHCSSIVVTEMELVGSDRYGRYRRGLLGFNMLR